MLLAVAAAYFILGRKVPVTTVTKTVTAQEVAPLTSGPRTPATPAESSALKRPFDRTNAALEQVKQRNGAGEF